MILLVRHALVDACGRFLAGRMPGIHLNAEGRRQADALGRGLKDLQFEAIYTSPLERACETAAALATGGVPMFTEAQFNEIDFGEWTGLTFDELNRRDDWIAFNRDRSAAPIPGGERMADVQSRACRALTAIARAHAARHVAVVSHGDVLRGLIAKVIHAPLEHIDRFAIDPGSVSVLEPGWSGFALTRLNCHAYGSHCCATDS